MLLNERLTVLVGRGLERRPWKIAGGPQADSRQPGKNREQMPTTATEY